MTDTNPIAAFNAAYAAAQAKCDNPALDSVNPAYRSKFSSLAATRNSIIPVFAAEGLAIQQTAVTMMVGERLFAGVHTVLRHKDGHVEDLGDCLMPVQKIDAQGIASCLTYAKRQSLQALAGVTGEPDDDANQAANVPVAKKGIGVHSPLGDTVPDDNAIKYADAFREALNESPEAVAQVHADLHEEGEEAYRNAWSLLDSKARTAIKKILDAKRAA